MSQETWEILCEMEADDVELQLALQCAPLITGLDFQSADDFPGRLYTGGKDR